MMLITDSMKRAFVVFIAFFMLVTPVLTGIGTVIKAAELQAEDIFFSEYIEGSSYNKAIEIYNGTGSTVDLSGYVVELYSNGSTNAGQSIELEGMLENNDVFVIANSQANSEIQAQTDQTSGVANFNGDDALVLKKRDVIIDVIHTVGNSDSTLVDLTLVRNSTNTKGSQTFNLEDWQALNKDTFSYLGSHTLDRQSTDELAEKEPPAEEELVVKSIQEIRQTNNEVVAVEGIVTAIFVAGGKANVYIQDETAGIIVRAASLETKVSIGDKIKAEGTTEQYYDMAQISATADSVSVVEENAGTPAPQVITSNELDEAVEAEFVTVKNIKVESVNEHGEYTASDENGTFLIDSNLVEIEKSYDNITGVVEYSFGTYRLIPRNVSDVIEDSSKVAPVTANPQTGLVAEGTKVILETSTEDAAIYYTTDGSDPTTSSTEYTQPPRNHRKSNN